MKITIIGCGRWGSLICWYLDSIGHEVTLYGRESSPHMRAFLAERRNDLLSLREEIHLSTDLNCVRDAEIIAISVPSQSLRALMQELHAMDLKDKIYVLCMKGIEIESGMRLSEIAAQYADPTCRIAVWLGPGHVQEFYAGVPNCMVIDSADADVKQLLVERFSSSLIRFYYGGDMIGNEIGAAAKNVIGIAAGILDGLKLSTLKGALMSRGTSEIARLIDALGGNRYSAYGLCHLGDYEATVFSKFSHNRQFGESFVWGKKYDQLAEGYYTVDALIRIAQKHHVELPICEAVYDVLYRNEDPHAAIEKLFTRKLTHEI